MVGPVYFTAAFGVDNLVGPYTRGARAGEARRTCLWLSRRRLRPRLWRHWSAGICRCSGYLLGIQRGQDCRVLLHARAVVCQGGSAEGLVCETSCTDGLGLCGTQSARGHWWIVQCFCEDSRRGFEWLPCERYSWRS